MATSGSYAKTSWPDREERSAMPPTSLKVTRAPAGAVDDIAPGLGKPLFRGTGDTDYLCGHCGSVIAGSLRSVDDPAE